jgi:PhnB protein
MNCASVCGKRINALATLMLGPENTERGSHSAKTLGGSSATLYLLTEDADKTVRKAVKLGATAQGPVMGMFWGDRCGTVAGPHGYAWMVATHVSEPTPQGMKMKMMEQTPDQQPAAPAAP